MLPTQTNALVKILSPTLHLYSYVLRNGINETPEVLKERRKLFDENLREVASHLTSSTGQAGTDIVKLVSIKEERYGSILDFSNVPGECRKSNNDRLYFGTGIISTRLAARRINDTYFLRLTRYVPSAKGTQSLDIFENLSEHLGGLQIELGQTAILAGIIEPQFFTQSTDSIAASCLSNYFSQPVAPDELIRNEFLDCPFYILPRSIPVKQFDNYSIESKQLVCLFLYENEAVEKQADAVYNILQNLLLSYHKIEFFYSQSLVLKKILAKQYEAIERQTEDYAEQKWDSQSLVQLPQRSLDYYKRLSFLQDQARLLEVHQINYRECLERIEQKTGKKPPDFFVEFEKDTIFYLEQMKADIGFLTPGIQLYEKLMLSVQTQISMNDAAIQERQAKLGQLLTGAGTAIAIGQMVSSPATKTLSMYIDKGREEPSVATLWVSALLTIILSLAIGYAISVRIYQWFTRGKL